MTADKPEKVVEKGGSKMALPLYVQLAYSVGHLQNDLCAAMWFSYLLLFETLVLGLSSEVAGILMLVGQIADALSTPLVGYCSDRKDVCCCKYGRRKSWHLLGTICVIFSFPFVFSQCFGCESSDVWAKALYYGTFICVFQFGWASVQISNLATVLDLTPDENERTLLFAYRNGSTVIANMAVYVLAWVAFRQNKEDVDGQIGPSDRISFQFVMITVILVGTVTSIFYHLGVPEGAREDAIIEDGAERREKASIGSLFKQIELYKIGVIYMVSRLFINMSQVLIPLYLQHYLKLRAESVASVPLAIFLTSFITSIIIKCLNQWLGRKALFVLGSAVGVCASVWVVFGKGELYVDYLLHVVAGLFGVAGSIMLVTSLAITADEIGENADNGAFIYGIMSLLDKLANGIVVVIVQTSGCVTCVTHYRDSLGIVCGVSGIIGILSVLTLKRKPRRQPVDKDVSNVFRETLTRT